MLWANKKNISLREKIVTKHIYFDHLYLQAISYMFNPSKNLSRYETNNWVYVSELVLWIVKEDAY